MEHWLAAEDRDRGQLVRGKGWTGQFQAARRCSVAHAIQRHRRAQYWTRSASAMHLQCRGEKLCQLRRVSTMVVKSEWLVDIRYESTTQLLLARAPSPRHNRWKTRDGGRTWLSRRDWRLYKPALGRRNRAHQKPIWRTRTWKREDLDSRLSSVGRKKGLTVARVGSCCSRRILGTVCFEWCSKAFTAGVMHDVWRSGQQKEMFSKPAYHKCFSQISSLPST